MNPIDALMTKCQQQEAEIQRLKASLEDVTWDYNEAMQQYDLQQKRTCEAEAKLELQPCGHPNACIVQGEQVGPGEFVHYCGWCQSLDVARWQGALAERERCANVAEREAEKHRHGNIDTIAEHTAVNIAFVIRDGVYQEER